MAAILLLGVSHAVADPSTTQTLVAMSLLTGEDQKPPAQKPKTPPPGSPGRAPAQPTAPAAPAKPGMPAPAAGTPAPTPTAPAAAPGPKEPPKPPASPATTMTAAPSAAVPPADSVEGYSYDPKSRRDPFQSLTKVIKTASLQSQMPPLQRVQISDMKLLGIMWGGYGYYGLIQTPDGKGYTV
ncbi:MAG: pilus assembly protein PilP, partial [Nitrospirae bacterium]